MQRGNHIGKVLSLLVYIIDTMFPRPGRTPRPAPGSPQSVREDRIVNEIVNRQGLVEEIAPHRTLSVVVEAIASRIRGPTPLAVIAGGAPAISVDLVLPMMPPRAIVLYPRNKVHIYENASSSWDARWGMLNSDNMITVMNR